MKKMTLIVTLVLIISLIFVGCGNSSDINENEEINTSSDEIDENSEINLVDFYSEDTGLSFKHPKEWEEDFPQVDGVIVSLNSRKEPDRNVNFSYYILKENEYDDFDATIKNFVEDYNNQFADFELLYYGDKEYNGLRFIEVKFSATFSGEKLVLTQYITQKGKVAYYITFTSTTESADEYYYTVQDILESIVIADNETAFFNELETSSNDSIIEYVKYKNDVNGISFNIPNSWKVTREVNENIHVIFGKHKSLDSGFTMAIADFGNYEEKIAWIKSEIEPNAIFIFDKVQLNLDFDNGQSVEGYLIIYTDLDDGGIEKKYVNFLGRNPDSENASLMLSFESIIDGQSEKDIMNIFDEFVRTINIEDYPQY